MSSKDPTLSHFDFPYLFVASDQASVEAQNNFVRITKANIALLIAAAIFAAVKVRSVTLGERVLDVSWLPVMSTLFLLASIGLTVILRAQKPERAWYDGRAVAESAKSLAWKYSMAAEPFTAKATLAAVDATFIEQIGEVRASIKNFVPANPNIPAHQISDKMRQLRDSDLNERKGVYLQERIEDQRSWYDRKAEFNKVRGWWFFWFMILFQLTAAAFSVLLMTHPEFPFHAVGVFTTASTAILTWTQLRKFQELSESYGVAAQELASIHALGRHINSEEAFSDFVNNSEAAISREHTLWVARRK